MPRKSRIDAPGALHHIIVRGIERRKIFNDDQDRYGFLDRLGKIIEQTGTCCYAWALIPNHFHLLLQTGTTPISTFMRRLLTGHAISYNRRHRRHGHLFHNRYKSILCQEDNYFLELVRYIHLNPLRAGLINDMDALGGFPFSGHSAIMGKYGRRWQDVERVLALFGKKNGPARRAYRNFVTKGIAQGKRSDLMGGGLVRSAGGWAVVRDMIKAGVHLKSDERILGDNAFVEKILSKNQEALGQEAALRAMGMDVDGVAERVAEMLAIKVEQVWQPGKYKQQVMARSLLCHWAVRELGESMTAMGQRLNISTTAVSKAVVRGAKIAENNGFKMF